MLLFFCKRKLVIGNALQNLEGPAIIAANHPDSMLDAIVIACECKQPVHFMIRSDMFKNPLFRFMLKHLNGIPVYRATEDKDKLRENFTSFNYCREVLKKNGIIIIFSEGVTMHDWKLKPFKSGTAKLVAHVLQDPSLEYTLQVAPVALTYSDYQYMAKTIIIQSSTAFLPGKIIKAEREGQWKQQFNEVLLQHLSPLVPEMDAEDENRKRCWQIYLANTPSAAVQASNAVCLKNAGQQITVSNEAASSFIQNIRYHFTTSSNFVLHMALTVLFLVPAAAGWLLNALYYYPITYWCRQKTKGSIFFDALAFGIYLVTYPLYVLLISVTISLSSVIPLCYIIIATTFLGWITIQIHALLTGIINYYRSNKKERIYLEGLMQL